MKGESRSVVSHYFHPPITHCMKRIELNQSCLADVKQNEQQRIKSKQSERNINTSTKLITKTNNRETTRSLTLGTTMKCVTAVLILAGLALGESQYSYRDLGDESSKALRSCTCSLSPKFLSAGADSSSSSTDNRAVYLGRRTFRAGDCGTVGLRKCQYSLSVQMSRVDYTHTSSSSH